jgi:hypothetical protein
MKILSAPFITISLRLGLRADTQWTFVGMKVYLCQVKLPDGVSGYLLFSVFLKLPILSFNLF